MTRPITRTVAVAVVLLAILVFADPTPRSAAVIPAADPTGGEQDQPQSGAPKDDGKQVGVRPGESPSACGQQTRASTPISAGDDERPSDDNAASPSRVVPAVIGNSDCGAPTLSSLGPRIDNATPQIAKWQLSSLGPRAQRDTPSAHQRPAGIQSGGSAPRRSTSAPGVLQAAPLVGATPKAHAPVVWAQRPTAGGGMDAPSPATQVAIRATWYCDPPRSRCTRGFPAGGMYAAISPDLRAWTGRLVEVCLGSRCVTVRVIDCDCRTEHGIDLYAAAFRRLADPGIGVLTVTLEVLP